MGWLFFLAAILGLAFPPVGVVVLAMTILGVFTKGVVADSQDQIASARRKARHRHGVDRRREPMPDRVMEPQEGNVIDVRCYPILPSLRLPAAILKPRNELH